jgi:hypothetical protein
MYIETLNPLNTKNWSTLFERNEGFSVFHSSEWARTLVTSYQYKPSYLVMKDQIVLADYRYVFSSLL